MNLLIAAPLLMIFSVFVVACIFDTREACCGLTNEVSYRMRYLIGAWRTPRWPF